MLRRAAKVARHSVPRSPFRDSPFGRTALLVALLLVLSGCSALTGPADTPDPTPTPTASPAVSQYPPGYGADGVANASRAIGAHVDGLRAAGSFTMTNRAEVATPNGTTTVSFVEEADLGAERAFVETNVSGLGSQARLFADGAVYARNDPSGANATYVKRNASFRPAAFLGGSTVEAVLTDASWTFDRETAVDGDRAFVYTPTNLTATDRLLAPSVDRADVTAFRGAVVVDASGVVREVRYRATIETESGTRTYDVRLAVTALGATTVRTPAWVDRRFGG